MNVSLDTRPNVNRWSQLADQVLDGYSLSREESLAVLKSPDVELLDLLGAAFRVRREHFGLKVQLYYLKNAKSGLCPEDCGYCSQAANSTADIEKYSVMSKPKLLAGAKSAADAKAGTYCIVSSGRGPTNREVEHLSDVVKQIKSDYGLHICCCLGLLTDEHAQQLKAAGVDRINHNLNTSRRYYDQVCTTHTYDDRLKTLQSARNAGMELCSGLIVGMGENDNDVVDIAFELRELGTESIPVNFLNSIDGTSLERVDELDPRYCLRALCLFRLTNPSTEIRVAGGREVNLRSMQAMGLYPANSIFVSDYLTTPGQEAHLDFQMIEDLGFEIVAGDAETRELLEKSASQPEAN